MKKIIIFALACSLFLQANGTKELKYEPISGKKVFTGKQVFETYCWGCHHQTAVAFGPPFEEIASKRSSEEIQAMITDPAGVSKVFGYKRNAMPPFKLNPQELEAITKYILSYKPKGE